MEGNKRNNGGHEETLRECANPECGVEYVVQHGGQRSGGSPSVHVLYAGGPAIGYCSTRCKFEANGWPLEDTQKWYRNMGMDYDKVFPPGYLAPSRIPTVLSEEDTTGKTQNQTTKRNGRG